MSEKKALKEYFGVELAERLSELILPHYREFSSDSFVAAVANQVEPLELKGRVAVITDELKRSLPSEYPMSLSILLNILGPENETEEGMFTNGYFLMPVAHFVEKYGLNYFNLSMDALYEITKRHTAEYAIRPYLSGDLDSCLKILSCWSQDDNFHVRRLVSKVLVPAFHGQNEFLRFITTRQIT